MMPAAPGVVAASAEMVPFEEVEPQKAVERESLALLLLHSVYKSELLGDLHFHIADISSVYLLIGRSHKDGKADGCPLKRGKSEYNILYQLPIQTIPTHLGYPCYWNDPVPHIDCHRDSKRTYRNLSQSEYRSV